MTDITDKLREIEESKTGGPMPTCLTVPMTKIGDWATDPESGVSVGLGINDWGPALSAIAKEARLEIERLRALKVPF